MAQPIPPVHDPWMVPLHRWTLPAFLLSSVAVFAWRRQAPGPARTVAIWAAIILFFLPPLWLMVLGDHSILLIHQQGSLR